MITNFKQAAIEHSNINYPRESAGFYLANGEYFPAINSSPEPTDSVIWSADSWIAAEGVSPVVGLVHSHPDGPAILSIADRAEQIKTGLDWYLVVGEEIHHFPLIPHLIGRKFHHGQLDCFTLVRDCYRLSGHPMEDIERSDDWWEIGDNLYLDNMSAFGFEEVLLDDIQQGDVILMYLGGAPKPNHAGVYLGDGCLLHHCATRLSKRDPYGGFWLRNTHSVWRHQQWQKFDFTAICNDLAASSI